MCGDADHDFNFPETCAAQRANWDEGRARHTPNLVKEDHEDASKGEAFAYDLRTATTGQRLKSKVSFEANFNFFFQAQAASGSTKRERKTFGR